jgi:hypothetical protein
MDTQPPRSKGLALVTALSLTLLMAACGGNAPGGATWTFGPVAAAPAGSPSASAAPVESAQAAAPSSSADASSVDSPKPFSGRMTHEIRLVDGYLTMYMSLENTGTEPLTFLNTLYDDEPDQLYSPTVVFPFTSGEIAAVTRAGRFFPSPAIVQAGDRAVYMMGGQPANGAGELAEPVANIKFCPTRGMDDIPGVPVEVGDLTWTSTDAVITVRGTLTETMGSRRPALPTVGVAFFDAADAFIGAVVDTRTGAPLEPNSSRPFEISGPGVEAAQIARAEAYAFIP